MQSHEPALAAVWSDAEAGGESLVRDSVKQIERWVWADGGTSWERPEPLWAETRRLSRSRRAIAEPAGELGWVALYGYDAAGALRLARRASGGTASRPRFVQDSLWNRDQGDRPVLLEFHYEGIGERRSLRLRYITVPVFVDGLLEQVLRWSGPGFRIGRERYTRAGDAITRVTEERLSDGQWTPYRVYDCEYDNGALAVVSARPLERNDAADQRHVVYRRSSGSAVRDARKRLTSELPDRIVSWAARRAPREPLFALALLYSAEGPSVPPALGVATERDVPR